MIWLLPTRKCTWKMQIKERKKRNKKFKELKLQLVEAAEEAATR